MKISDKGLDLIKKQESYLTKQRDGSCRAYRCPVGKWTCGWGCTEGVGPNTHWTLEQATDALRREMDMHEANVMRLVKVPLEQGQFDALVSLCYNIGAGALAKSSVLKHTNAGDMPRAASHFADFKYGKVRGDTAKLYKVPEGTRMVLPGLVTRRAAEAQMFLESVHVEAMPQKIEPPTAKMTTGEAVAKVGGTTTTVAGAGGLALIQSPPDISQISAWKGVATEAGSIISWAMSNWMLTAGAVATFLVLSYGIPNLPKIKERLA